MFQSFPTTTLGVEFFVLYIEVRNHRNYPVFISAEITFVDFQAIRVSTCANSPKYCFLHQTSWYVFVSPWNKNARPLHIRKYTCLIFVSCQSIVTLHISEILSLLYTKNNTLKTLHMEIRFCHVQYLIWLEVNIGRSCCVPIMHAFLHDDIFSFMFGRKYINH